MRSPAPAHRVNDWVALASSISALIPARAPVVKERIETETTVEDGEAVAAIFKVLGYTSAFVYEKWRSEWADSEGHCVLDETPIGQYAELGARRMYLQTLDLDDLDHLELVASEVMPQM